MVEKEYEITVTMEVRVVVVGAKSLDRAKVEARYIQNVIEDLDIVKVAIIKSVRGFCMGVAE